MPVDPTDKLAAGLAKVSLVMRHHAWSAAGQRGVTPTQAQVLVLLASRDAIGVSISAIASELAVTQPTISDAVAALVRKKLVVKSRAVDDARIALVRLTPAGKALAAESALWPDAFRIAVEALEAHEREVLQKAIVKMIHAFQEAGRIPLSRMCTSCTYFRPHAHPGALAPHHCAFVDAPFGDADLRIDCPDHEVVPSERREALWTLFVNGQPPVGACPAPATP